MRDPKLYLTDILDAMEAIELFVEGMDLVKFKNSDLVASAVVRKFEVIGEATKNLPEPLTLKYPGVPWKKLAGMRDRLIHFYYGVKHELVWDTIKDEIPKLKKSIREILGVLDREQ